MTQVLQRELAATDAAAAVLAGGALSLLLLAGSEHRLKLDAERWRLCVFLLLLLLLLLLEIITSLAGAVLHMRLLWLLLQLLCQVRLCCLLQLPCHSLCQCPRVALVQAGGNHQVCLHPSATPAQTLKHQASSRYDTLGGEDCS
jgi:hypothetical protein